MNTIKCIININSKEMLIVNKIKNMTSLIENQSQTRYYKKTFHLIDLQI